MSDPTTPNPDLSTDDAPPELPPGASPAARRMARRLARPIERFLTIEASSGILLIIVAAVALLWANSPWADLYHDLWHLPVGLAIGEYAWSASTHFVVNDILMSVFFLVVGLEIRRELSHGELSDPRRAALPAIAALGGMVVPALFFTVLAESGDAARGWGVPMATDIAFAVGVLALLGRRVPPALRVLLLALAIIDDLGAIIVIAIFYSSGIDTTGFMIGGGALVGFAVLHAIGARSVGLYLIPGLVLWVGTLMAGVHPTIAGVITGMLIPTRRWPGHETQSPAAALEHALHPWVAYAIMPVFALANAGVALDGIDLSVAPGVAAGIVAGLVLGKPVGVLLACFLAVKLGIATLPRGITWGGMVVLGGVAGIGFTMALFIAELAYGPAHADLHAIAKISVLGASVIAAIGSLVLGRLVLSTRHAPGTATSEHEAERSTDA